MSAPGKSLQLLLQKKYLESREKNPSFSMRAYSKRLGISPTTLSLFLRGQRMLSRSRVLKISQKLELRDILSELENEKFLKQSDQKIKTRSLTKTQERFLADWKGLCFLSLMKTSKFKTSQTNKKWIAKKMGLRLSEVTKLIQMLLDLGLIYRDGANLLRKSPLYTSSNGIPSKVIAQSHLNNLNLAKKKLQSTPIEFRDYQTLTFPFDLKHMSTLKVYVQEFLDKVTKLVSNSENAEEVYRLGLNLFPLTTRDEK